MTPADDMGPRSRVALGAGCPLSTGPLACTATRQLLQTAGPCGIGIARRSEEPAARSTDAHAHGPRPVIPLRGSEEQNKLVNRVDPDTARGAGGISEDRWRGGGGEGEESNLKTYMRASPWTQQ